MAKKEGWQRGAGVYSQNYPTVTRIKGVDDNGNPTEGKTDVGDVMIDLDLSKGPLPKRIPSKR